MNKIISPQKYAGLIMSILTLLTLILALRAVPISGAFAPKNPLQYPYLDTTEQYPRDYIWMYSAIFMMISYIVYMIIMESRTSDRYRIFSRTGLLFALFAGFLLITTYFLQAEVIPVNIMHEQYDGVSLFTQYNPYGMFIALEVLGYLFMSLSLLALFPLFNKGKSGLYTRVLLILSTGLTLLSYILLSLIHGLEKMERVEVVIICITWLELIILGFISFFSKRTTINEQ